MTDIPTRPRLPTKVELTRENSRLRREIDVYRKQHRRFLTFAVSALPDEARCRYERHVECRTDNELGLLLVEIMEMLMESAEQHAEPYEGAAQHLGVRVKCPLCTAEARGPNQEVRPGWGYPKGLWEHLRRDMDSKGGRGCGVMQTLREHAQAELELRQLAMA